MTLPKIVASSVIRSLDRHDSHGGVYIVDLNNGTHEQVIDWNDPSFPWYRCAGDVGVRGVEFYGDLFYAVAGDRLLAFDKTWTLVAEYSNQYFEATHESWLHEDKLYICSDGKNAILVFDLIKKEWTTSICHPKDRAPFLFNPLVHDNEVLRFNGGFHHLDSVTVETNSLGEAICLYAGAFDGCISTMNMVTGKVGQIPLIIGMTHNARMFKDGIIYCKSVESEVRYEVDSEYVQTWKIPLPDPSTLTHVYMRDCWRLGYVRGMVSFPEDDMVVVGSSPAEVFALKLGEDGPIASVSITNDFRNSICGMCKYEW